MSEVHKAAAPLVKTMEREDSIRSSRNAYYVAMAVAVAFLGKQLVGSGGYETDVFAVLLVSQIAYWGSVLYYRRSASGDLPLVDD